MLQFDEYKVKLNNLRPALEELSQALNLASAAQELEMLESESAAPGFWDNLEKSQKVTQRMKQLQNKLEAQKRRESQWEDLLTLCEMGNEEEDGSLVPEVEEGYARLEQDMEEARLSTLLTGEYDNSNAILTIHAGAGGTEAQDWAQMLYRMYTRWAERHDYTYQVVDYLDGDEAGIKSATIMIQGENAYGHLKSEHGVHRLVRVSPFDANARRQTSFAALEVMPEIPDDVEVDIRPEDIDIVPVEQGQLTGTVTEVTFKGMHYDIIVDFRGFKWLIQTTDFSPVGARIGVKIDPDGFHIMKKSAYSGKFGDYSSYSDEYDELSEDAEAGDEE